MFVLSAPLNLYSVCRRRYRLDLESVVLNHRVGKELTTHVVGLALGVSRVWPTQRDLEVFARPNVLYRGKAERAQAVLDGVPLGIVNHWFKENVDLRQPHRSLLSHWPARRCQRGEDRPLDISLWFS